MLVELGVVEQRYRAVLEVLEDGTPVMEVARRYGVARQTVHEWLSRYGNGGLAGLADRSSRPASCPHQMPPQVEARIAGLRREHPGWGPSRIRWELERAGVTPPDLHRSARRCRHDGVYPPGYQLVCSRKFSAQFLLAASDKLPVQRFARSLKAEM